MATGIDRPVQEDPGRPPDPQNHPTLSVKCICLHYIQEMPVFPNGALEAAADRAERRERSDVVHAWLLFLIECVFAKTLLKFATSGQMSG